jgi:hypothetical protein
MAASLNTCTTIEQRGVVRFFVGKNMEVKDIHKKIKLLLLAIYTEFTRRPSVLRLLRSI